MQVTIRRWKRLPLGIDESPGMPTYRITGTATPDRCSPVPFIGDISVERDGRDLEYRDIFGRMESFTNDILDALSQDATWLADYNAQPAE